MAYKQEYIDLKGLQEQLKELGFHFSEDELTFLWYLAGKSNRFRGHKRETIGKDVIDYRFDASMIAPFAATGYHARLQRVPPIMHGTYDGVDTRELEELMNSISWQIPAQNNRLLPKVYAQMTALLRMNKKEATDIVAGLQVKYWSGTPMAEFIDLAEMRKQFELSHYFYVNGDVSDVSARSAYNLLCGRAVLKFQQPIPRQFQPCWQCLEPAGRGTLKEKIYPFFPVQKLLENLPLAELKNSTTDVVLFRSLIEGDLTQATFTGGDKEVPVLLTVGPARKDIIVYDMDQRRISLESLSSTTKKTNVEHILPAKKTQAKPKVTPGKRRSW